MQLKSIEIQGFKSFADKIKLDFQGGITAIVGPNGSGKSNVADAVRWVLGEQSVKLLRGNNMQDVIFAGTEARKPVSLAHVAITINNEDRALKIDYDEVVVARRVYRSGDSEYLINGSVCRLRDVHELFYDTGIGKEGYSIIGQGQIDRILGDKPEEKRELFDEAVGIVKLKKNKNEALKNLEKERQSLTRVVDIMVELEKQLPSLEDQAKRAIEFLELRDNLREIELSLFKQEIDEYNSKLKEYNNSYKIASLEVERLEKERDSSSSRLNSIKNSITELDNLISNSNDSLNELEKIGSSLISDKRHNEDTISHCRLDDEKARQRLDELSRQKTEKLEELKEKQADIQANSDFLLQSQEKLKVLKNEKQELEIKLDSLNVKLDSCIRDFNAQNSQIAGDIGRRDKSLEQLKELERELSNFDSKNNSILQAIENISNSIDDCNNSISESKNKLTSLEDENNALVQSILEFKKSISDKEIKFNELSRQLQAKEARIDVIRGTLEHFEGYNNAIKAVMSVKTGGSVIGVVGDLIKTEDKYVTAIETALGGRVQNIVTDNENTAKNIINYLKQEKKGRATLLPLSMIKGRPSDKNHEALKQKGSLGFADMLVDVVNVKEGSDRLKANLLSNILVVDNIDNAVAISKKFNQNLRIVTLGGEQIGTGGSMTGGAFKSQSNFLSRHNELDNLKKQYNAGKQNLDSLELELKEIKNSLKISAEEQEVKQDEINSLKLELKGQELTIVQLKRDKESLNKDIDDLKNEFKYKQERYSSLKDETESIEGILQKGNKSIEELSFDKEKLEEEIGNQKSIIDELNDKYSKLTLKHHELEQNQSFNYQLKDRLNIEISQLDDEIKNIKSGSQNSDSEIERLLQNIVEIENKYKENRQEYERLSKKKTELEEEKRNITLEQAGIIEGLNTINDNYAINIKEEERLKSLLQRLDEEFSEKKNYIFENYEYTVVRIEGFVPKEEKDINQLRTLNKDLKFKIKSYGSVNLAAVEEYKELEERYSFLNNQRNDIMESESKLLGIIEELDTGMRTQFIERFKEINYSFNEVFQKIFNGGKATLTLEEGDVLEAGININIQPPGKKLHSMKVLSGGEKALGAIALLFAIQSLKPSPFCLLDEIEAALDDSNVARFAKYLSNLTDNTQFILITHRKGTMAVANKLYGITMQEKGISKAVSVNLVKGELENNE